MLGMKEPRNYISIKIDELWRIEGIREGVYAFFDHTGEILYIGKSGNLRRRLLDHTAGKGRSGLFSAKIDTVRVYVTRTELERELLETYLINKYRPAYNISKVYSVADVDVRTVELEEAYQVACDRVYEIQEELAEFKEVLRGGVGWYTGGFSDESEGNIYALGEHLYATQRLKDLREELAEAKEKRSSIRKKLF